MEKTLEEEGKDFYCLRIERISIINTAILLKSNLQTQYSSHQNDVIIHRNRETKFIIHIEAQKTLHNKSKFKRKIWLAS